MLGEPAQEGTMSAEKATQKSTKRTTATGKTSKGWTAEERAAAKAYAQERKAEARGENDERAALAAIAAMPKPDRTLAERLHAIIKASAPDLSPKTWYGMPAYANPDDKVVLFFKNAGKFNERYSTLGFEGSANLDDGDLWPVVYVLQRWSPAVEKKIVALVKTAIS